MSQPPKTPRSDLRTVLDNIDVLLHQMRSSVNAVSGQLLAMTISVECITLAQKLRLTLQRWKVYLPFHESRDVNFKVWVRYFNAIHKSLGRRQKTLAGAPDYEYYPDDPFCLDLIEMLDTDTSIPLYAPRYAESELQRDVMEYVDRVNEQLERIANLSEEDELEWHTCINKHAMSILRRQYADHLRMLFRYQMPRSSVEKDLLPKVSAYLNSVIDQPAMAYCLDMSLDNLLDVMRQIDQLFSADKTSQQFMRLSLRLYFRYCPDAQSEAESEVHRWATEWPGRKRKQRALERRDQLVDGLRQRYGDLRITDYVDLESPCPLSDFEFGQFLFASRHKLEVDEVKDLFQNCLLVQELNRLIDPAGSEASLRACRLSGERKNIYNRLTQLVRQTEWLGGMTAERVHECFAKLLLYKPASPEAEEAAALFWDLLTMRRNCEEGFRSLKLTWLNLVGYFRSRGCLKGGSLLLCRSYFPDNTEEGRFNTADHNFVNKGARDDAGNNFHDLIEVLDQLLGLSAPQKR